MLAVTTCSQPVLFCSMSILLAVAPAVQKLDKEGSLSVLALRMIDCHLWSRRSLHVSPRRSQLGMLFGCPHLVFSMRAHKQAFEPIDKSICILLSLSTCWRNMSRSTLAFLGPTLYRQRSALLHASSPCHVLRSPPSKCPRVFLSLPAKMQEQGSPSTYSAVEHLFVFSMQSWFSLSRGSGQHGVSSSAVRLESVFAMPSGMQLGHL